MKVRDHPQWRRAPRRHRGASAPGADADRQSFRPSVGHHRPRGCRPRREGSGRARRLRRGQRHFFINNSPIGTYPELVQGREAPQRRGTSKRTAQILAAFAQLGRATATMDGVRHWAWLVLVGNGPYGTDMFDLASRDSLNQGVLDVRLVRADRFLARTRAIASVILGRLHRSPLVVRRVTPEVRLNFDTQTYDIALDGEVMTVATPLHYRSRPGEPGCDPARDRGDPAALRPAPPPPRPGAFAPTGGAP